MSQITRSDYALEAAEGGSIPHLANVVNATNADEDLKDRFDDVDKLGIVDHFIESDYYH